MKKLITILFLSLFGVANALYLTISAYNYKGGDTSELFCDVNATFSCSSLFGESFAWIFGIPFPAIALVVYPILALIALLAILGKTKKHFHILGTLAVMGMMFNAYIIFNEFRVQIFCLACLMCSVAITLIAIMSWSDVYMKKSKKVE